MPNIKQYDAPQGLGLRPTETGIEATAASARRIQGDYSEAAAARESIGKHLGSAIKDAGDVAVKYIDHQQISHGAPAFANTMSALNKEWDDTVKNADPNDPTVAQKFLADRIEPELEKFKGGFWSEGAQKWAESHVDAFRQHMFNKTSADMATMAGHAAAINAKQTENALSNTVRSDPSSLDFSLKTLESSLDGVVGSSPNLTGTAAAKVKFDLMQHGKEAIIKSAAMGHIEKTGEVPGWATDPKYAPYINGAELKQFQSAARYYNSMSRSEQRAAKNDADNAARTKLHTDMNGLELSLFNDDGELIASKEHIAKFREIVKNNERGAALEPGRISSMLGGLQRMVERNNRIAAARDDPATRDDLTARMFDADNPTTMMQIAVARNDGKLGPQSARNLGAIVKEQNAWLHDPVVRDSMHGAKQLLGTDPVGAGKYASFVQDFVPQYAAAKRAGTLTPDALDLRNPESMISKAMKPYQRSPQQIILDKAMRGDVGQVQPSTAAAPAAGTVIVKDNVRWRFKGGDVTQQSNWERL